MCPVQGCVWCWTRYTRKTSAAKLYLKCKSVKSASIDVSFQSYIKYQRQRMLMSQPGGIHWVLVMFFSHLFCSPYPPHPPTPSWTCHWVLLQLIPSSCWWQPGFKAGKLCITVRHWHYWADSRAQRSTKADVGEIFTFFLYIVTLVGGWAQNASPSRSVSRFVSMMGKLKYRRGSDFSEVTWEPAAVFSSLRV